MLLHIRSHKILALPTLLGDLQVYCFTMSNKMALVNVTEKLLSCQAFKDYRGMTACTVFQELKHTV